MTIEYVYFVLLSTSLIFLCSQLLVKKKRAVHIVFALFCGSMAMVAAKQIGAEALNPYHYLIGLGTCATCNAFWLVSRGLFRTNNAIEMRHIVVALFIAGLIMLSQILQMAEAMSNELMPNRAIMANAVSTLTQFLSSTILTLTFWEAFRGYSSTSGPARHQRTIFLVVFIGAIFMCMFVPQIFINEEQTAILIPWFTGISAITILWVSQGILLWQSIERSKRVAESADANISAGEINIDAESASLVRNIRTYVEFDSAYLKSDLKMKDVANKLDLPEYRISRAIRQYFDAENFNQYINTLRVKHAKNLLKDPEKSHWTVLVIALESGFSSVVSFNRVFKSENGFTPSEFRKTNTNKQSIIYRPISCTTKPLH